VKTSGQASFSSEPPCVSMRTGPLPLSPLAPSTPEPEASDFLYGATFIALPLFVLIIAALASAHPPCRALRYERTSAPRLEGEWYSTGNRVDCECCVSAT
jgi:hypothetical protein